MHRSCEMLCVRKAERSWCSPDLRLQHYSPEGQKYLFKSTSTGQRPKSRCNWTSSFLGHLGRLIILSLRHTTSSTDTDWIRPHSNNHFWGTSLSYAWPVFLSWRGRLYDNTTNSHGCPERITCHSYSWWGGCLCPARMVLYYHTCDLASPMYMVLPVREWASTDITETTARIKDIAGDLLAIHYSYPSLWHWETDSKGQILVPMGNVTTYLSHITSQATEFITACYDKHVEGSTVTDCRQKIWAYKTCRGIVSAQQTWFTANNISCISWKCKMLPLSGVQLEIGIAPTPFINLSIWIWLESRHRE